MVHVQSDAQPTLIVVAAAVGRVATAVRVARGYAACAGGGRWRVYGTRVVAARTGTCGGSIRERSTTDCQADVCRACGLVRHTSYRTGQVVRYAGSGALMAYQR